MSIRITIIFGVRECEQETVVEVPVGTTLQQAMALLADSIAALLHDKQTVSTGVWGKVQPAHYVLRDGDRIEMYRPLKADPKQARRARAGTRVNRS